ncbi:MAG: cell envelope integrity protein CreD [Caulobacterales bacterium]
MSTGLRLPTRSIGLKFLLVCLLALAMGLSILAVYAVMQERLNRSNAVRSELGAAVGGAQTLTGPVLLVPFAKEVRQDDKIVTLQGEAIAFAETGAADAKLTTEIRKRGIFQVPTFTAGVDYTAAFDPKVTTAALAALDPGARYDFSRARMVLGVTNTTGFLQEVALTLPNGQTRPFAPLAGGGASSPGVADVSGMGLSPVGVAVGDLFGPNAAALTLKTSLTLTGAERFSMTPFAKNTTATIQADWADPSFEGGFLPTKRNINAAGFTASWDAPLVRRGVPEVGGDVGLLGQIANKDFAVRLVEPTTAYTGVDRALKFGLMFIGLVFLTYFMFEVVTGLRAHPAQYIMVGLSQATFYLLLLAFAERIGFDGAFMIAAGMTVAMIAGYVVIVFKKAKFFIPAFVAFVALYGLMYVLMQMEDYALIVGSLTLFGALALLMLLTRKVDWYGEGADKPATPPPAAA